MVATKMMRELLKVAKEMGMSKVSMHGPLRDRGWNFENFLSELRLVLSMHTKTERTMENFPQIQQPEQYIKSELEGRARTLAIAHQNDGCAMLEDLII